MTEEIPADPLARDVIGRTIGVDSPVTGNKVHTFRAGDLPMDSSGIFGFFSDRSILGGQGLFASRDLKPGERVYRGPATVAVLDSPRLEEACSDCFVWAPKSAIATRGDRRDEVTLRVCSGCKIARYCSKSCQSHSWKEWHKLECKSYAKLQPKILPNTVRLVVRLLLADKATTMRQSVWSSLVDSKQSHITQFEKREDEIWENICLMAKGAKAYSGTSRNEYFVREMICKLLVNTLTLVTPTYDPIGICYDDAASNFNHSCDPNIVISLDGAIISAIALTPIKKGQELTISYIDTTNPFHIRQSELNERYFFKCACALCQKGREGGPDRFSSGFPAMFQDEVALAATEEKAFAVLEQARKMEDHREAVRILKKAMEELQNTRIWRWERQPWAALRQQLIVSLISSQAWIEALAHALKQLLYVDPVLYTQRWHPIRVVHCWVLARLIGHIFGTELREEALKVLGKYNIRWNWVEPLLLGQVFSSVKESHGGDTQFACMVKKVLDRVKEHLKQRGEDVTSCSQHELEEEMDKLRKVADELAGC